MIPYYFVAVHNEPYHVPDGRKKIAHDYVGLKQMLQKADEYHIKLTLMLPAQWADYIVSDAVLFKALKTWKERGHEIAAHHHGMLHEDWDGFSNYGEKDVLAEREKRDINDRGYLGTMYDYINKLRQINPDIKSGCMNDEADKTDLPDEIIYDTCSGFANFGEIGRSFSDFGSPLKGKNDFISIGTRNNITRKWLANYALTTNDKVLAARAVFNSMNSGVYGVITHSMSSQLEPFFLFMDFLYRVDPDAEYSRTISQIIEQRILPEKVLPAELLNESEG